MKLKWICFLSVLFCSHLLLAKSTAGIVAGVASNEEYCDGNSQLAKKRLRAIMTVVIRIA
jgi:hypothetical protein